MKYPTLKKVLANQDQNVIVDQASGLQCVRYILEHEREDYIEWCGAEEKDPADLNNPHIYCDALKALGLSYEPDEVL